ncbi:MAG: 2-hydroxychromene-2-carboxylate isomerase [Myxococcota bacterium]
MTAPVEFWFDFSSGYAYFAALEIEALAARHGRAVLWRPYLLGVAFQATGARGLSNTPLKGDYARRDWARLARRKGVPFALPAVHPVATQAACRVFYWLDENLPDAAPGFARGVLDAHFVDGRDVTDADVLAGLAERQGAPPAAAARAADAPEMKQRLREVCDGAVERGIFGSPFFVVDDEPFWGWDRLPMLDDWLARGGW